MSFQKILVIKGMKKRKILLFLLLVCLAIHVNAQTKDSMLYHRPQHAIFFAPLNVFDFVNPSLQFGYERIINDKFSIQLEGAYIINHSVENYLIDLLMGVKDCPYTNSGFRVESELKYFIINKRKFSPYASCELFYLKNKSGVQETFIIKDTTFIYSVERPIGTNSYDQFFINDKQQFGINIKAGIKSYIGKHFFIEPHLGVGIGYRISKQYGRENLDDEPLLFMNEDGNMFILNFPFNFKIGYRF